MLSLTHSQLGLTRPEMTARTSPPPIGSLGEFGWLWHLQTSSSWGSTLDTGLARRFPDLRNHSPPLPSPPSAPCCLGACQGSPWRQHRHFRGACPPPFLHHQVNGGPGWAPGCSNRKEGLAPQLCPQTAPDQAGGGHLKGCCPLCRLQGTAWSSRCT